jgi:hypothetical protein
MGTERKESKHRRLERVERERREKGIAKFKARMARKKLEAKDPEAKRVRPIPAEAMK